MLGGTRRWNERRTLLASRMPVVRIDRCTVTKVQEGGFRVEIDGLGLNPAISPPTITVGGQDLQDVEFEPAGRRVTGRLESQPANDDVVVDLGYAQARGRTGSVAAEADG